MQAVSDNRVRSAVRFATHGQQTPSMFLRPNPVRPQAFARAFSSRGFSTQNTKEGKDNVLYSQEYLERQETENKDAGRTKGKFFEFIQKIDQLD